VVVWLTSTARHKRPKESMANKMPLAGQNECDDSFESVSRDYVAMASFDYVADYNCLPTGTIRNRQQVVSYGDATFA
jgi:hypothetical protein